MYGPTEAINYSRQNIQRFVSIRQFYVKDGKEKTTYICIENHLASSYISRKHTRPGWMK